MIAFSLLNGFESTSSIRIESSKRNYCDTTVTDEIIEPNERGAITYMPMNQQISSDNIVPMNQQISSDNINDMQISSDTISAVTTITATTTQQSVDTFVSKIKPTLLQLANDNDTYKGAYYYLTHGIVYKYNELIPYHTNTGKKITALMLKELKNAILPESDMVKWLNVKKFLTNSNRKTIQNSGGGNCWWKSISYYLWSDERKYLDLKEILLLFLTQDENQFGLYFGNDKLNIRNNIVEFLIATPQNCYSIILNTLLNPPKDDYDKNGWAEAVWIDLLIMAVIWPDKRFCVLSGNRTTLNLEITIGERVNCYGQFGDSDMVIPEVIHELLAKIYKGTELVADLDNFNYDLVQDVNFILYTGQHYFVAPKK